MSEKDTTRRSVAPEKNRKPNRTRVFCALCMWPTYSNRLACHWKADHSHIPCAPTAKKYWDGNPETMPAKEDWFDENASDWLDDPDKPLPQRNRGHFTPTKAAKAGQKSRPANSTTKKAAPKRHLGKRANFQRKAE